MKITIDALHVDYTPALAKYADDKFEPIRKLLAKLEAKGEHLLALDISRTTRHHRKGPVFRAEANLKIGKTLLRAEATEETIHAALDAVKDELKREVVKFKEKFRTNAKRNSIRR